MATSSINHVFIVKDPKKVEKLAISIDKALRDPQYKSTTNYEAITNSKEAKSFVLRWKSRHK